MPTLPCCRDIVMTEPGIGSPRRLLSRRSELAHTELCREKVERSKGTCLSSLDKAEPGLGTWAVVLSLVTGRRSHILPTSLRQAIFHQTAKEEHEVSAEVKSQEGPQILNSLGQQDLRYSSLIRPLNPRLRNPSSRLWCTKQTVPRYSQAMEPEQIPRPAHLSVK